jgi:glycosyltransferase involved in cell wall biosynthesis
VQISIVLTFNEEDDINVALSRLASQQDAYEIIVVSSKSIDAKALMPAENQARLMTAPAGTPEVQFNTGAAAATGEVLFFLKAEHQLPDDALAVIRRNFELLPQSVGGTFHVKFKPDSLGAKFLSYLLKWWRYRGRYSYNSGLFVRKDVYQAIGGFQADAQWPGYDFARRLEAQGPTLYPPEAIVMPTPNFSEGLAWITAPILAKVF